MANVVVERQGDCLFLNVDGSRLIFLPTGLGVWKNNEAGEMFMKIMGNQILINTGISHLWAYPSTPNTWIVSGEFTPGPDPDPGEGGDYSWPYDPASWVTSEFGPRNGRFHEGIDFSGGPAVYGEPIPAIGDGTVQLSGSFGAFGYTVILHHGTFDDSDWKSLYAHQPADAPRPSVGTSVNKGDIIGQVNNSGSSFGSHLHLEIHRTAVGGNMVWDNLNPSYQSPRTAINPRHFFTSYGDGEWLI